MLKRALGTLLDFFIFASLIGFVYAVYNRFWLPTHWFELSCDEMRP